MDRDGDGDGRKEANHFTLYVGLFTLEVIITIGLVTSTLIKHIHIAGADAAAIGGVGGRVKRGSP